MIAKKLRFLGLFMSLWMFVATVFGQTDVTNTYLINAGFNTASSSSYHSGATTTLATANSTANTLAVTGWTAAAGSNSRCAAAVEFGFGGKINGASAPAFVANDGFEVGTVGVTNQGCLGMSGGYGTNMIYYQQVTLPAGTYKIKTKYYNNGTAVGGTSRFGFATTAGGSVAATQGSMSTVTSFPLTTWTADSVQFTLLSDITGYVQVGFTAAGGGSASSAKLFWDYAQIILVKSLDVSEVKASLKTVIDSVNNVLTKTVVGNGSGQYPQNAFDGLTNAKNTANSVYTNSNDQTEVKNSITALTTARTTFFTFPTLKTVIDSVSSLLTKVTVGTAYGQCSQTTYDALLSAKNDANAVYTTTFSQTEITNAATTLSTARTTFFAAINQFVPDPTKQYNIIHTASSLFVTEASGGLNINAASGSNNQFFKFIPVGTNTGVYHIQVGSTMTFVAKTGTWDLTLSADSSTNVSKFRIENIDPVNTIFKIFCLDNSKYVGTDLVAAGSLIYSDKNGTDVKHRWTVQEVVSGQLYPQALTTAIATATALKNAAVVGTKAGNYPQDAYDTFSAAIVTATNALSAATTQLELDNAVSTLNKAITAFKISLITIRFNPQAGAKYRMFCASGPLNDQYVQWTNDNTINWAAMSDDEKQYFIFEKINTNPAEVDTFYIKMRFAAETEDRYVYARGGGYVALRANIYATATTQSGNTSPDVLKWTVSYKTTKDTLGQTINYFSFQNVAYKASGKFINFGSDGTMQSSNGTFGSGVGEARYQLAVLKVDARTSLQKVLETAKGKLATAVVGTEMGQYTQVVKDSLQKAINIAQVIYDNQSSTDPEVNIAQVNLSKSLAWFISQQVSFSTAYVGKKLYIIHSGGYLLSQVKGDSISLARINSLGAVDSWQEFEFEAVPGEVDVVSMKSGGGKYLAYSGGWNTMWSDTISAETKLKISATTDGYLNIKFVNKSYLGTNAAVGGEFVYADKGATSINSKWDVQTPGSAIKIRLKGAITLCDTVANRTKAGTANFEYPQIKRDVFVVTLTQAKAVLADASATQSAVDQMYTDLNAKLNEYYKSQILPVFSPETGVKYFIKNKKNAGYINNNGTMAVADQNVPIAGWEFVPVKDSVFVIKSGDKALAHSLNMVAFNQTAIDQQWYVHYDGLLEYGIYQKDTTFYYGFTSTSNLTGTALQFSGTAVATVAVHSHTDQSQWFSIKKIGAPITDVLKATITQIESILTSTVVGAAYGQYPQSARDSLNTVLNKAKLDVVNVNLTQIEINNSVKSLTNALTYYYNQKVVYKPLSDMGYFFGNYADATIMSVDTINANNVQGYKLDSIPFDDQMWFFKPVENKAGYYYILNRNKALSATGVDVELTEFIEKSAKQWEITYTKTVNGIEYFNVRGEGSTYPYLYAGTNWAIDRYNGNNNYQIKIVAAGGLRTQIFIDHELLKTVTIGNKLGQYTQDVYNTFSSVINSANAVALNNAATDVDRATKLQELKNAETAFKNSYNGYGLDLSGLNASLTIANSFIETTTVIGSESGQCPETVFNALLGAKEAAIEFPSGLNQAGVDAKVIEFNAAIETFKSALLSSTGLPDLIESALTLYNNAVEGTLPGQYAVGSKVTFYPAIEVAQQAKIKQPLVQSELMLATQALQSALDIFNAAKSPDVDVRDLVDAIAAAKEFLQAYPEDQRTDVRSLVQAAEALLASSTKTQEEVDDMTNRLITALTGIDDILNDQVKVLVGNFNLYVRNLPESCKVAVYGLQGQLVVERRADNEINIALKGGAYIVSIQGNHVNKRLVVVIR